MSDIIVNIDAPIKATAAYFNAFVGGELDSLRTHAVFVGVIAAAEISLGVGIWLESPKNKTFREWLGLSLVLGGCVVSVIATVALLIFDEGISRNQNDKIIALEKIIVPRHWYGGLNGSVLGSPTGTSLFEGMRIDSELSKFPKMKVLIQVIPQYEARRFAQEVSYGLSAAGWAITELTAAQSKIGEFGIPEGVQIWTRAEHDDAWKAAEALQASMSARGVFGETFVAKLHATPTLDVRYVPDDIRKSPPEGTVVILIGEKPGYAELGKMQADEYRAAHPDEK